MSRNDFNNRDRSCPTSVLVTCIALVLVSAIAVACLWLIPGKPQQTTPQPLPSDSGVQMNSEPSEDPIPSTETDPPTTETKPEPVHVVSTAHIISTGDVLMHKPVMDTAKQSDGSYNFDVMFQYVKPYVSDADYAVANLETTFGGDGFPYQGNPSFNCYDTLMDTLSGSGFDMLLTANNHCADTLMTGINRTLEVVRSYDVQTLGTRLSEEEDRYVVEEVNGIKIGMVCYTYTMSMVGDKPNLNGNTPVANPEQLNFFDYYHLDKFYAEMEQIMTDMKADGAEASVLYIHWGNEYQLKQNNWQSDIAQKMCDLGVDVIIGGHPHVVQPVDLLTSKENPEHKTVCLYSMGNAISNQRLGLIGAIGTAHTEDGVLFSVSFSKYSDGTVVLEGMDLIPCWVNMFTNNGKREYNILPLDDSTRDEWQSLYSLTDTGVKAAANSYDRTMKVVGEGIQECQDYLAQAKADREAAYLAAVQ